MPDCIEIQKKEGMKEEKEEGRVAGQLHVTWDSGWILGRKEIFLENV